MNIFPRGSIAIGRLVHGHFVFVLGGQEGEAWQGVGPRQTLQSLHVFRPVGLHYLFGDGRWQNGFIPQGTILVQIIQTGLEGIQGRHGLQGQLTTAQGPFDAVFEGGQCGRRRIVHGRQ